jgi:hypothetical protein
MILEEVSVMDDKEKTKKWSSERSIPEAQEVKEILSVVSSEVPALIKGLVASVFSEEAGRSMGKGAAAYYKSLKEGGLPEDVAVRMTEDYVRTFTSFGEVFKNIGHVRKHRHEENEDLRENLRKSEDDEEEEEEES